MMNILREFANQPEPEPEQIFGSKITTAKDNDDYRTRLVRIGESFGFGITAFKERTRTSSLLTTNDTTKVIFLAVDTTASMSGVIEDVCKQISTILTLTSNLLPVKIILALYGDYETYKQDDNLIQRLHFIHVSSEVKANEALRKYWKDNVVPHGGGDAPEMNLTLMATIIKYYTGIITTDYDNHGFVVSDNDVTSPQISAPLNCAVIQISDAQNRDPCVPGGQISTQGRLEAECLNQHFKSLNKWSDIDGWCLEHKVPYICLYVGGCSGYQSWSYLQEGYVGPWIALPFSLEEDKITNSVGGFLVSLVTCLLGMTSLDTIKKYSDEMIIPVFKKRKQFQVESEDMTTIPTKHAQLACVPLTAVEDVWRDKVGEPPVFTSGRIMIEALQMDEEKREYYYKLCMTVARSDYFMVMTSNPVFAEIITALKTTWTPQQSQEFHRSLSDRLSVSSETEKKSYAEFRESGKTKSVTVCVLINQLIFTPMEEKAECQVVRLEDQTAKDGKATIGDFNMQHPKYVEALYKLIKGLKVEKTTKEKLGAELKQYTDKKESHAVTFAPVIDKSTLPAEVTLETDDSDLCNLDALELRGIMRLYNGKLFLSGISLTAFAMMCVICARRGETPKRIGQMGEEYLASLAKKRVNWLHDKINPERIRAEACGVLYTQVIRHFWELYADQEHAESRENMVSDECWSYITIMAVMHLAVYKDVKLPVLEMEKTLRCKHFSVQPAMTQLDDTTLHTHTVRCKVCSGYKFKGATLDGTCVSCIASDHLVYKCKSVRNGENKPNCLRESPKRRDFDGEMYCKICTAKEGEENVDLSKEVVSFVKCNTCSNTYACNQKDFHRSAKCFLCIFIDGLRQKLKNINDLKSFLGDLSNPTLMIIQLGVMAATEGGYARTANINNFTTWAMNTMKQRNPHQETHDLAEKITKKLCNMKFDEGEEKMQQDAPQIVQAGAEVRVKPTKKQKKIAKANKRKAWKALVSGMSYKEKMDHIIKRREKRSIRQEKIDEKKMEKREQFQNSNYEVVLRKVRDKFTRTCSRCKMSVVYSPESEWQGCLVCDRFIDPTTSPCFKQIQRPLKDIVPLEVMNKVVLHNIGVELKGESWSDLRNLTSIGQFFGHIAIKSGKHTDEMMEVDDGAKDEMVQFCDQPFNYNFIFNHLLNLNKMFHGKGLTSAHINEMKGSCVTCGDAVSYMYSFHTEGSCSGVICRPCATRNYWIMIREAKSSSKKLSAWLSCMFCRQVCGNLRNIWIWIGARFNITSVISDITEEESIYFRGVLNALSDSKFKNLKQELESSPDVMYNICRTCLQLKRVSDALEPAAPCCAAEMMIEIDDLNFVCEDCSKPKIETETEVVIPNQAFYPENTVEAALFQHQMARSNGDSVLLTYLVRQCPSCQHDISKESGCMVMHCPVQNCRVEFCFVCGDKSEGTCTYTHLRDVHDISYYGDAYDEDQFPHLSHQRVETPGGFQYLYTFDKERYQFNVETMRLESLPGA